MSVAHAQRSRHLAIDGVPYEASDSTLPWQEALKGSPEDPKLRSKEDGVRLTVKERDCLPAPRDERCTLEGGESHDATRHIAMV